MTRVTQRTPVVRVAADGSRAVRRPDHVTVEEPLEIRLNGTPFQVTMRTPGADLDLVHGLLYSEGVIARAADIASARYCDGAGPDGFNTYNVLDVRLADGVALPEQGLTRNVLTTSACGVCGSVTIDTVMQRVATVEPSSRPVNPAVLAGAPDQLRAHQKVFDKTGGVHAVGLVSAEGELLAVREDVGRHNAADKVIGWALREGRLPAEDVILVVSARASFELTQKAVLAGCAALVAVSAPTSLAVDLADRAGLVLAGFVRAGAMNLYTHVDRVASPVAVGAS